MTDSMLEFVLHTTQLAQLQIVAEAAEQANIPFNHIEGQLHTLFPVLDVFS